MFILGVGIGGSGVGAEYSRSCTFHMRCEQSSVQSVFAFELCAHGLVTRRVGGCMYLLCAYGSCTPELFNCPLGEKLLIESCQKMGAGTVPAMDLYAHLLAQDYSN